MCEICDAQMRNDTGEHAGLSPADLLSIPYVEEFEGVTTLDTILMDWDMCEGRREDFARWLIETISQHAGPKHVPALEDK